jgi:hypothetical protein
MSVDLSKEIAAYERQLADLRQRLGRRWVVFLDEHLQGDFPSFDNAFEFAMRTFPDRDFLIRDTEAERVELPFLLVVA